jgi:hypothetical protein
LLPVLIASGFGVAAVGGLVGTVVGVISLNRAAELERQCMTACSGDEIANGEAVSHVSTAGFVIGGVGAVVGTVALILYLRDDDDASSAIQLHVGRGSLQLEATF